MSACFVFSFDNVEFYRNIHQNVIFQFPNLLTTQSVISLW
jgi:hypothetical protein